MKGVFCPESENKLLYLSNSMMYSAVLLLYAILKQRDGVPKTGKGAEGHGAERESQ